MTTDDELRYRLNDFEDNYTERKSAGVKPQEIRQTMSAFANSLTAGATAVLFIGVNDKTGAIEGVPDPDGLQKRVRECAARDCYPPITSYTCRVLEVEGKQVLAVKVGASENRPHFTGPAYVRRGSESVAASADLFNELVACRTDKVARILRMRGGVISFQSINHIIGSTKVIGDRSYRESGECKVEACDAHLLRLTIVATGQRVAEPLEHVQITYDEERHRDMLVIRY